MNNMAVESDNDVFESIHGMHVIYDELLANLHTRKWNIWTTMAVIQGVDKVINEQKKTTDNMSVVCGLIISAIIPLITAIPDDGLSVAANSWRTVYIVLIGLSLMGLIITISLNLILVTMFNMASRQADKFRLVLKNQYYVLICSIVFMMSLFMAFLALCILGYFSYGLVLALVAFTLEVIVGVFLVTFCFGSLWDIIYGPEKNPKFKQDLINHALKKYEELARKDKEMFPSTTEKA
ncbi:hypothetical protein BC937DRAFT_92648 [Endogone sp. FLAS-F59071]|nr:hypothetical protein BC937DRAFT_92648 [Endogone sp. FLAS-F59071]|eukprot:RUS15288.1 hypothetical protein BC937DRAFT_92648 [Endogone sp. FLAS-F59071]